MTISVQQILEAKGHSTYHVSPDATVFEALQLMAEKDVGGVLVVSGGRLEGIFTERDYARKVILHGRASKDTKIDALMTPNVCTVTPSHTVEDVMSIMTDNRFRHLPVVERGHLVGIVTIGDVVKAMIEQQKATIDHLSNYISGELAV